MPIKVSQVEVTNYADLNMKTKGHVRKFVVDGIDDIGGKWKLSYIGPIEEVDKNWEDFSLAKGDTLFVSVATDTASLNQQYIQMATQVALETAQRQAEEEEEQERLAEEKIAKREQKLADQKKKREAKAKKTNTGVPPPSAPATPNPPADEEESTPDESEPETETPPETEVEAAPPAGQATLDDPLAKALGDASGIGE